MQTSQALFLFLRLMFQKFSREGAIGEATFVWTQLFLCLFESSTQFTPRDGVASCRGCTLPLAQWLVDKEPKKDKDQRKQIKLQRQEGQKNAN